MDSLAAAHDAAVQMIDTSIVRVHQRAACIARNRSQSMGRSRGGLTSKIHAVVTVPGSGERVMQTISPWRMSTSSRTGRRAAANLMTKDRGEKDSPWTVEEYRGISYIVHRRGFDSNSQSVLWASNEMAVTGQGIKISKLPHKQLPSVI
jgi:hypothetical protein